LTQTADVLSEQGVFNAEANAAAARDRFKVKFCKMNFTKMTVAEFSKFVDDNFDDLITNQEAGYTGPVTSNNASKLLTIIFHHPTFTLSKAVSEVYNGTPPALMAYLPRNNGPHRPVTVLPRVARSDHGPTNKTTGVIELLPKWRKHGLTGFDVPNPLGSPILRLKGILGILTPGFCSKSISAEEVRNLAEDERRRAEKTRPSNTY